MNTQSIPDMVLIPARAEGLLAKRWSERAVHERLRQPIQYTRTPQRVERPEQVDADVWQALTTEYQPTPHIAAQSGRPIKSVRDALNAMERMGAVSSIRPEQTNQPIMWRRTDV